MGGKYGYGVTVGDLQEILSAAIGGMTLTTTVEGRERFPVRLRYARELRDSPDELIKLLVLQKLRVETSNPGLELKPEMYASAQLEGKRSMMNNEESKPIISGVTTATWNQSAKQLHINFESSKTSIDAISRAMAKVGHDTDKYKANQATYEALPDCCKYR